MPGLRFGELPPTLPKRRNRPCRAWHGKSPMVFLTSTPARSASTIHRSAWSTPKVDSPLRQRVYSCRRLSQSEGTRPAGPGTG